MPADDTILLNINANTADAVEGIEAIEEHLRDMRRLIDQVDNAEVARSRRLEANANARARKSEALIAQERRLRSEIEQTTNELKAQQALSIRLSNERSSANAKATAEYKKQQAAIEQTANEQKAKDAKEIQHSKERSAFYRTHQSQLRVTNSLINKQTANIRKQTATVGAHSRSFVAGERTKQAEIRKTANAADHRNRVELEGIREINREKARRFRRDERVARQEHQQVQGGIRSTALATAAGVGLGQQLTNLIGQIGTLAGGFYFLSEGIGSIIRDRARVQRLEVGVRDLTDTFRQQAILPQLQDIALLPGLDYVTATAAFTRALSGGFTDQQSLRLINQIRNAVALSQGSIEDTNEVLRQFIQIQARGRFDQENLRPILERAPFIRRVIQAEFGTQIGGEIQQVIEGRGMTTTEGILRIVEGLAAGPVADPTTLQNALDNVRNELILLNNELGRRIEPVLRRLVDGFTETLRFLQGGPGAVLGGSFGGALGLGTLSFLVDFARGRHLRGRDDILRQTGYNRFFRSRRPVIGSPERSRFDISGGVPTEIAALYGLGQFGVDNFLTNRDVVAKELEDLRRIPHKRDAYIGEQIRRAERLGKPPNYELFRAEAEAKYQYNARQRYLQQQLFLDDFGYVDTGARRRASLFGRPGQRIPFLSRSPIVFQNPFRVPGRDPVTRAPGFRPGFRSPIATRFGGGGLLRSGLAIGTPGLIAAGAAVFGGAQLGISALETRARGGVQGDQWWVPIINGFNRVITAGIDLGDSFIRLSKASQNLLKGGIPNFESLISDVASGLVDVNRRFAEVQSSLFGVDVEGARAIMRNPLLEYIATQGQTLPQDITRFRGMFGVTPDLSNVAGANTEQRKQLLELFRSVFELDEIIVQASDTAVTEREKVRQQIRMAQRRLDEFVPERYRSNWGFLRETKESQDRRKALLEDLKNHLEALEKIELQENKIVTAAENLNKVQAQINEKTFLYVKSLEDFTGGARGAHPGVPTLERIFTKEDLKNLNEMLKFGGHAEVTMEELAKTLQDVTMELGNVTDRPILTGLGQLRDKFGNLTRSAKALLESMKPLGRRAAPPTDVPLGAIRPGIPTIPGLIRGGDFSGRSIDILGAGLRQIRSTPGSALGTGPLVSGDRARAAAFGAIDSYRRVQESITQGVPFDPNNPATIIPRDPGETLDVVTLDRFRRLNSEWQELLETSKEFGKTRGIFDFMRGSRKQEVANLIVQITDLRTEFEGLRDSLPEDSPLRQQLLYLVNTPIEQLTRQIKNLKNELAGLSGTALQVESLKSSFQGLMGDLLGRRTAHTGIRALGRQLGGFFQRFDRREGRRIIRERQLDRARAFEGYFASTAEGLYNEFLAPSILDALGIGPGRSTNHERALERLKEDMKRVRQETLDDERISEQRRATELLEINREYLEEKRLLEREYEEERNDAWGAWVRQQLTDFPRLIFQQLNLQLAARATNAILRSLGIGGRIPITGPGIPGLGGSGGGGGGGGIFGRLGRFFGGGSQGVRPELSGYGGGAGAGGLGASSAVGTAAGLGTAASFALAAHNIATGVVPQWNPHGQSLYDDFGYDVASATGLNSVVTFFDNLIFHNARNDAMARSAGMQARIEGSAARLGRESARDIVTNFSEGFNEGGSAEKMYVVPSNTTFSLPIIIGDQETRQISYTIDQLVSEGRI